MKRAWITVLKFAVSFGILAFLFYRAWQQDQFAILTTSTRRWEWWLIGLGACLAATLISFYRWWALVRAQGIPFSLLDAIRLGFISQMFNLLSIGVFGGDAMRAFAAARQAPGRMPEAVAAVAIDRAIGLLTMCMFGATAYWCCDLSSIESQYPKIFEAVRVVCWFATAVSIVGAVGLILLLVLPGFDRWRFFRWLFTWPKVGSLIKRLVRVVVIYRGNKPELFCAFLNSMSINALLALSIFAIAHGISDQHPTLMQHLVISPVVMVANAAPLPGGLGGMEISMTLMYQAFSQASAPADHGFIVALGYRVVLLVIAAIGAVFYFVRKPVMPAV